MARQSLAKKGKKLKKYSITIEQPVKISSPSSPFKMLQEARKARKSAIDKLYDHYAVFSALPLITFFYPLSLDLQLQSGEIKEIKKKEDKSSGASSFLRLVKINEILTPTLKLCLDEFHLFIVELQIGSNNGAARSLRYILETAVEACEFQTERHRPTCDFLLAEYKNSCCSNGRERQSKLIDLFVRYNGWTSFVERYNIYEKTNRIAPTFRELVNNLNALEMFQNAPQISDELKAVYVDLSDYVHPSAGKFVKTISNLTSKRYRFDPAEFDTMYQLGLKVLDCTEFLFVTAMAKFYNCTIKDFMGKIAGMIKPPQNLSDLFFALPYSKRLSEDIVFHSERKSLRKTHITAKRIMD